MKTKPVIMWEKFYKDDQGNIVLWQAPNAPLWGWMGLDWLHGGIGARGVGASQNRI